MYDELSTQSADYEAPRQPIRPQINSQLNQLEQAVGEVLTIERQIQVQQSPIIAQFGGTLLMESEAAYDHLDQLLEPLGYHAQFSLDREERPLVSIIQGRFDPQERPWWPNALLFVLTVLSTMFVGAQQAVDISSLSDLLGPNLLKGLPYAISIMLILGAHELGHYFAGRRHNVSVTLPYFLPMPFLFFGTLGAFIQLREPMRNRKQLFDIGVSGPLAGLIFAIPILWIGIATSDVEPLFTEEDCAQNEDQCVYIMEGNSIFYAVSKRAIHGEWLPAETEDMMMNQMSFAGWTGMFVTALNLLPIGQLDGGHVMYSVFGKAAKRIYMPAMIAMVILAFNNQGWILWVFLLLIFGRIHAVPLNDITPLDNRRRMLGIAILLFFFLIFTPSPFTIVDLRV